MDKPEQTRNQIEGERLRQMRLLMGITSTEVCLKTKMNNGQYSRIEAGELSAEKCLPYVERLFMEWRKKEIKKLQTRIDYFNSLTN